MTKFYGSVNFESIHSLKNPTLVTIAGLIFIVEQSLAVLVRIPTKIGIEVLLAKVLYSNKGPPESPCNETNQTN